MDTISEDLDHERKGGKRRCETDLTSVHDVEHPSKKARRQQGDKIVSPESMACDRTLSYLPFTESYCLGFAGSNHSSILQKQVTCFYICGDCSRPEDHYAVKRLRGPHLPAAHSPG
jgi:hypothetical protein